MWADIWYLIPLSAVLWTCSGSLPPSLSPQNTDGSASFARHDVDKLQHDVLSYVFSRQNSLIQPQMYGNCCEIGVIETKKRAKTVESRLVGVANNNKDSRVSSRFHCTAHLTALHSTGRQPLSFISQISLLITLSPIPILCSKQSRWFEQWLMERKVNNKRNHFEYKTFSVLGQFVASPLLGKNNLTPMLWW